MFFKLVPGKMVHCHISKLLTNAKYAVNSPHQKICLSSKSYILCFGEVFLRSGTKIFKKCKVFSSEYYSAQRWLSRIFSQIFSRLNSVISAKTRISSALRKCLLWELRKAYKISFWNKYLFLFHTATEFSAINISTI